jgi:RNA-directed DNA polymerase
MRDEKTYQYLSGGSGTPECRDIEHQITRRPRINQPKLDQLMKHVLHRENMFRALGRVTGNRGAAGPDGMSVDDLPAYLRKEWRRIKDELERGIYQPGGVRVVEIPKPKGGVRKISIPNVIDRLIQQAIAQVLTPAFDPHFSEHSYGFRPQRSAGQAVLSARRYMTEGRRWVVDIDLEKFFDRINHDILMSRVARRVNDKKLLLLIRRYLEAGAMVGGLVSVRAEGAPQGGPLSPILSNIMLDDLDRELENRGHTFCRYADDCNIYVFSRRAGERVMESITRFLEKRLKLRVNREKSSVDRPWNRDFLGYTVTRNKLPRLRPSPASVKRLKYRIRQFTREGRGRALEATAKRISRYLKGWASYFRLSEVKATLIEIDQWIRHRLRTIVWRQWKTPNTRFKRLVSLGLDPERAKKAAGTGRGPWWNGSASHMHAAYKNRDLRSLGLVSLLEQTIK